MGDLGFVVIVIAIVIALPLLLAVGMVRSSREWKKNFEDNETEYKCICCLNKFKNSKYDGICNRCGDSIVYNVSRR